jgi:hypothetical protein
MAVATRWAAPCGETERAVAAGVRKLRVPQRPDFIGCNAMVDRVNHRRLGSGR